MTTILLSGEGSWPANVVKFLESNADTFVAWHTEVTDNTPFSEAKHSAAVAEARRYDRAIHDLSGELMPHLLRGYHCTRLTNPEIAHIRADGMGLPNIEMLAKRIAALVSTGEISSEQAAVLAAKNQADEEFRKGGIWFFFYEPHLAGQGGIEDLLQHWGGEALYNSHDRDTQMGPILRKIGTPCVIEVDAPVASLRSIDALSIDIGRAFASRRRTGSSERMRHEGCVTTPLAASRVTRIIRYPDAEFRRLTGCDQ